jgi:hypothetical protein
VSDGFARGARPLLALDGVIGRRVEDIFRKRIRYVFLTDVLHLFCRRLAKIGVDQSLPFRCVP